MVRFLSLLVVFLGTLGAMGVHAQTVVNNDALDFGDLYTASERFQDVLITNKGRQKAYILRVEQHPDVVHQISSDLILPDSSFSLRLQVNPKKKGPFSYQVKVFMSDHDEPIIVRLNGNVKELPTYSAAWMQRCPDFNSQPSQVQASDLTIITIDKESGKRLSKSTVSIIRNGEPVGAWITGRNGEFNQSISPGYFYFFASHDGYLPKEAGVYVGPEISEITIPLRSDLAFCPPVPTTEPEVIAELPQQLPAEEAKVIIDRQLSNQRTDSVIKKELPELASLSPDNFESQYFRPVNVVFVLDVSSSMKQGEKMDLMKYALNQLVDGLRAEDHIALVTYSEAADVLLEPTACDQKTGIKDRVGKLKPQGLTAGGRGIKLGYKQAMKQLSPDKANMVIIITDGAFNKDSDDYQAIVKKHAKDGITFSVVGIQNSARDEAKMREAAAVGHGRYVPIAKLSDAQHNLLQEIRIASYRK